MNAPSLREVLGRPALVLGLVTLFLHLWVNGGYGYFRDELYFIVCGRHPAWGYTDQPPLVPMIAWASDAAFHSLRGLRLIPAVSAAATVALSCVAAERLGGGVYARWLAGLTVLAGGALQTFGVLLATDTIQPIAWLAIALLVMQADRRPSSLILAGAIAGIAFLAKYTAGFYCGCLAAGLLLTPQRRLLWNWQTWAGVALALVIATPNLIWQEANGWPFVEHTTVLANERNIPFTPVAFLGQVVLTLGPVTAPVWIAGFAAFALWPRFTSLRWIALSFLFLLVALIAGHGRPYYAAPAFPLLMAGGAVASEAFLSRAPRLAFIALVLIGAIITAPLVMPVLPVQWLIAYQTAIGLTPSTGERLKLGPLPQYFADMFGWSEMADIVADAYARLSPEDRRRVVFFGRNYGEAAAIDFFAPGAPPAISGHENYHRWGPGERSGEVVFVLARHPDELNAQFRSVEAVGRTTTPFAMPDEIGLTLWLCRDPRQPLRELWPMLKHYG